MTLAKVGNRALLYDDNPHLETMNTLRLTDYQLQTIMHACEVYDRINGGQIQIALDEVRQYNPDSQLIAYGEHETMEKIEAAFRELHKVDSPMRNSNSHSWIGNKMSLAAREIRQTIRRELSLRTHPEGGWTTNFDEPLKQSGEPLPKLTKIEEG